MPRPWFRANNTAAAIGAILMSAEDFGVAPPKVPEERRLGRFVLPPFQRPAVWTIEQKVRFIESIWGGLPLGAYVYNQPPTFRSEFDQWLLDGQQRISAILEYVANKFPVHGHLWSDLTVVDQRVFKMIPMSAMETQIEDEAQLLEIYDRLAYGGTAHAPKKPAVVEDVSEKALNLAIEGTSYGRSEANNAAFKLGQANMFLCTAGERDREPGQIAEARRNITEARTHMGYMEQMVSQAEAAIGVEG